jgi:hypothetical protein
MPPLISLGVILTILGIGIYASVRANRRAAASGAAPGH